MFYEMLFGNIPGRGLNDHARLKDLKRTGILFPSEYRISENTREFLL
jgi:hypothetical protein